MIQAFQRRVAVWVESVFGLDSLLHRKNRALRVVEEAVELAQAEGCDELSMYKIVQRVYSRPVGSPPREGAAVFLTLLAWAEASRTDLPQVLRDELDHLEEIPAEHFRQRQREKHQAGTDLVTPR